jgi:hypothetical protein
LQAQIVTDQHPGSDLQLIQYAKHKGIKTINVVRRDEHIQELKDAGCGRCSTITRLCPNRTYASC